MKDFIVIKYKVENSYIKDRHESQCNNFVVRFVYEFFLEFCIVALINLSVTEFDDFHSTFSYLLTLGLALLVTALFLFTLSRLFWNGPYIPGFYQNLISIKEYWGIRPLNPKFDPTHYLEANKAKLPKKPKGWFRFFIT